LPSELRGRSRCKTQADSVKTRVAATAGYAYCLQGTRKAFISHTVGFADKSRSMM
jgi:hypothetical protein